jgi:hypothetical protein
MTRMKKLCAMAALMLGAGSLALRAAGNETLVVTVPFEFVAGTTKLPAGEYRVQPYSETGLLMIQGNRGRSSAMVFSTPVTLSGDHADAALIFSEKGGVHVLSGVQFIGLPARAIQVK